MGGWTIVTWERRDGVRQEREYRIGGESKHDLYFGGCPVTQHCAGMKRLWKHIAECKDQQCQMAHCVSSRYMLSHYHRCKDPRCAVCGPVREAIQRNHEKAKQLAMAQQVSGNGTSNADSNNAIITHEDGRSRGVSMHGYVQRSASGERTRQR